VLLEVVDVPLSLPAALLEALLLGLEPLVGPATDATLVPTPPTAAEAAPLDGAARPDAKSGANTEVVRGLLTAAAGDEASP
jgi:hypothetical protein